MLLAPPPSCATLLFPFFRSRRGSGSAAALRHFPWRTDPFSGFADGIDHRRGNRLSRRLPAPNNELKCRVNSLAFGPGNNDKVLDLLGACRGDAAQQHGMAKRRRVLLGGEVEMPEPQLFVGKRQQLEHRAAPTFRHLHVESAREMERADLFLPYEIEPVFAPAPGNLDD